MSATCPAGPPKLKRPIFAHTRTASRNDTRSGASLAAFDSDGASLMTARTIARRSREATLRGRRSDFLHELRALAAPLRAPDRVRLPVPEREDHRHVPRGTLEADDLPDAHGIHPLHRA